MINDIYNKSINTVCKNYVITDRPDGGIGMGNGRKPNLKTVRIYETYKGEVAFSSIPPA